MTLGALRPFGSQVSKDEISTEKHSHPEILDLPSPNGPMGVFAKIQSACILLELDPLGGSKRKQPD